MDEHTTENDAPVTREFRPRKTEVYGGRVSVEITTEDHTVLVCGPLRAEPRECITPPGDGPREAHERQQR